MVHSGVLPGLGAGAATSGKQACSATERTLGTATNGFPTFPTGLPRSAGSGKSRCLAWGHLRFPVAAQWSLLVMGAGLALQGHRSARSRGRCG